MSTRKKLISHTVISTIGSTVSKLIKDSDLNLQHGKIITNSYLQVKGYENVWAIGDAALIPNKDKKNMLYKQKKNSVCASKCSICSKTRKTFSKKYRSKSPKQTIINVSIFVEGIPCFSRFKRWCR